MLSHSSSHPKDTPSSGEEAHSLLGSDKLSVSLFRLASEVEALALRVNPWLRRQTGAPDGLEVKPDGSQVTACDKEMERLFRETCERVLDFPFVFLGEESEEVTQTPEEVIASARYVAVCDPIDGTANFIHGNGLYGCLLGIVEQREAGRFTPIFGAVSLPERERLYITEGEDVIELNLATGERAQLQHQEAPPAERLKISAYSPQKRFFVDGAYDGPAIERVMANASIMDIERLIKGEIHASLISGKWWDVAALMAVTEKLGFEAISLRDGSAGYELSLEQLERQDPKRRWALTEPFLIFPERDKEKLVKLFRQKSAPRTE